MKPSTEEKSIAALRWRCRRGMREVDLLLEPVVHGGLIAGLDESERVALGQLLDLPDGMLLDLLMGRTRPEDTEVAGVVDKIRHAASD